MIFSDRREAGRLLAQELQKYAKQPNTIVLALPRGGVPVGFEIARALHLPLDVFLVRKLGVPDHEELAMGAIAMGDIEVLNEDIVRELNIPRVLIDQVKEKEQAVLTERNKAYRGSRPMPKIKGTTIILVDDGVATGATIRAAITALKKLGAPKIIVAVPVISYSVANELASQVDDIVALAPLEPYSAIGARYHDFSQTEDEEVSNLLEIARSSACDSNLK